jgi:hypothetical protein
MVSIEEHERQDSILDDSQVGGEDMVSNDDPRFLIPLDHDHQGQGLVIRMPGQILQIFSLFVSLLKKVEDECIILPLILLAGVYLG